MGPLLQQLLDHRDEAAVVGRAGNNRWLFPGHGPGRHIGFQRLTQILHQHGIQARRGRNSALADLAADMPAILFTKLLGLSIESATAWTSHIDPSRAAYAAHRIRP
jgi:hypothetical protein